MKCFSFSNRLSQLAIYLTILGFWFFSSQCNSQQAINDISTAPKATQADYKYIDIFKPLDGQWQGEFLVYEDTLGQQQYDEQIQQKFLHTFKPSSLGFSLRLQLKIDVEQTYFSESPYFQRVEIIDRYHDKDGEVKIVKSVGVNKIQDGKMWCVVKKPDETVIHSGTLETKDTIIWQRKISDPLKIEYFREIVTENEYTILGWGFYSDDKPGLNPKTWFYGRYEKIKQLNYLKKR